MEYELNFKEFWEENTRLLNNSLDGTKSPLFFILEDHFIQHAVKIESTLSYYENPEYTINIHKKCNDILEKEIGIRYYAEDNISYIKGAFEVVMGAERVIREGNTPWLESTVEDIEDVKKLILKAEKMDMRKAIPDEWREKKTKLKERCGKQLRFEPPWNGPATMACNLLGTTNTAMFIMDEPEVMKEFFTVMAERYVEFREAVCIEDSGTVSRNGIGVNDDSCYLFPPKIYEEICAPFLKKFFDSFAPMPHHKRRQHSDSSMGHLMGILNDLGVNEVNLGPEIPREDIRKALPNAIIHGHMPPFLLQSGNAEEITQRVKTDIELLSGTGKHVESPAGVVPVGTPYENLRTYMLAVQTFGR